MIIPSHRLAAETDGVGVVVRKELTLDQCLQSCWIEFETQTEETPGAHSGAGGGKSKECNTPPNPLIDKVATNF